jgi:hypothetical protein
MMAAGMMLRGLKQRLEKERPDIQNVSFIGEMAENAPKLLLPLAKRLRMAGHSMEEILNQTGWFTPPAPGAMSHWKTEVPDTAARFNPDFERELTKPGTNQGWINKIDTPMKHAFDSPLWQHYPDLGDIPGTFAFGPNLQSGAAFKPPKYMGQQADPPMTKAKIRIAGKDIGDMRRAVLHELQHGVQWKEFWPRGGSPDERHIGHVGRSKFAAAKTLYDLVEQSYRDFRDANPGLTTAELNQAWKQASPQRAQEAHQLDEMGLGLGGPYTGRPTPGGMGQWGPEHFGYHTLEGETEARNVEMRDRLRQIIAGNDPQATLNLGLGPIDTRTQIPPPWATEDMPSGLQHRVYEPFRRGRLGGI